MGYRPCATTLDPEMTAEELTTLDRWIRERSLAGDHLEIGTAAGGTLCFLMSRYAASARPKFSVVDTMAYFEDQLGTVKRNLEDHELDSGSVDFRIASSETAFARAEAAGERFDFILVDASHKIRHVMNDLRWLRLLQVGGLACFHDYGTIFKGVTWPLDRIIRRNPQFQRLGVGGTLLGLRKIGEPRQPVVTPADRLWASIMAPLLQWEQSLLKRLRRRRMHP